MIFYRNYFFITIAAVISMALASCGPGVYVSGEASSFTDSAAKSYSKIFIASFGLPLDETLAAEGALADEIRENGAVPTGGIQMLPPTQDLSGEEILEIITSTRADSVLILEAVGKETVSTYVPQSSLTTGTITPAFGGATFNRWTTNIGGYHVSNPTSNYRAQLIDLSTRKIVWISEISSKGIYINSYAELAIEASKQAVQKLKVDGLIKQ